MNNRIAVFTNGFSNEFIELVITGLQKKAKEDGVDIFVFVTYTSQMDHELQNKCQLNIFHLPDPADFDGAIMLTNTYNFPDEQERVCARFQRAGVPMLSLEVEVPDMSCIKSENYKGVYDLAKHLVEHHGAKRFVYVNGVKGNVENLTRRQALIDVLNAELANIEMFLFRHCGSLSGGTADNDRVCAVIDLIIDKIGKRVIVDRLVRILKRCNNCYCRSFKY